MIYVKDVTIIYPKKFINMKKIENYINISSKYSSKPYISIEGLKILWCNKEYKVVGYTPGAWIVKNR